jgi:hypothetical protein
MEHEENDNKGKPDIVSLPWKNHIIRPSGQNPGEAHDTFYGYDFESTSFLNIDEESSKPGQS